LLDTHAWIWWLARDERLGPRLTAALDGLPAQERPFLSDISLWEVAMLFERGRLHFTIPFDQWLETAAHARTVRLLPITPAVAAEVAALPKTFHRDPADRVIVATCRVLKLPLVSRDALITRSRLVKQWEAEK
jgi:PIN domain nuclease of toxin-antitoxin system